MGERSEREWLPLELVKTSAEYLTAKGIPTPRLDAEVLLCAVLGCSRVKLYTLYAEPVSSEGLARYREMIRRRVAREPVSRILGKREFMGLEFVVTPDVLSPRPETEILVERVLQFFDVTPKQKRSEIISRERERKSIEQLKEQVAALRADEVPPEVQEAITRYEAERESELEENDAAAVRDRRLLDLGTGSGCIPISVVCQLGGVVALGVDISREALRVAQDNAERLGVAQKVEFRESDFFQALDPAEKFDIIVSNPPYLVEGDSAIWPEVSGYDPELALYGGVDGLACYRLIIAGCADYLLPGGQLLLELGAGQLGAVTELVREAYPGAEVESIDDYSGIQRVLVVRNIC